MERDPNEYVLGTHDAELERLGLQHRLWAAQATAIWTRAGFGPGQILLDVGCGPGFATLDLARWAGPQSRIVGVDQSERFIRFFKSQAHAQALAHVEARIGNVEALDLPAASLDGAFCRWVLCWIANPLACVQGLARAIRPGGVVAVQDYFSYHSITLAPRSEAFTRVVAGVVASQRATGGDPDLAGRLPRMLIDAGFEVLEIEPILRVARPGSALWQWPDTFFRIYAPRLVAGGFLSEAEQVAFEREWNERCNDPATFLMTPPVFDIIARKK